MFRFTVPAYSVEQIVTDFRKSFKGNLVNSLDDMRRDYQDWMRLEQQRGDAGGWTKLSTSYEKEKERNYPNQPILSRTGNMMKGYIQGIRTVPSEAMVVIDFPGTAGFPVHRRAKAHQDGVGVPQRPFPVDNIGYEEAVNIAMRNFRNAIQKSLNT
jgi:hypothetical protein